MNANEKSDSHMIAETLKMNPADAHLFIFRSRSGNKLVDVANILQESEKR